jgi:hypothetical protein
MEFNSGFKGLMSYSNLFLFFTSTTCFVFSGLQQRSNPRHCKVYVCNKLVFDPHVNISRTLLSWYRAEQWLLRNLVFPVISRACSNFLGLNYPITRKDTSQHIQIVGPLSGWGTQPAIYVYGFFIAKLFHGRLTPRAGMEKFGLRKEQRALQNSPCAI